MKFYTLGLIITIVINARGCKDAQLLAEHKYLHFKLHVCVCTCVHVPAGEERLSDLLSTFPKRFAR